MTLYYCTTRFSFHLGMANFSIGRKVPLEYNYMANAWRWQQWSNRNKTIVIIIAVIIRLCHFIERSLSEAGFQAREAARLRQSHCNDIWQSPSVLFLSSSVSLIVNKPLLHLRFIILRRLNRVVCNNLTNLPSCFFFFLPLREG